MKIEERRVDEDNTHGNTRTSKGRIRVKNCAIPVVPVIGYREALHLHDVHHFLAGYSTKPVGEVELAAWELASGGCGLNLFFWLDRFLALALGLFVCPRRLCRAASRGWKCRNLYGRRVADVLATDLDELRHAVGLG